MGLNREKCGFWVKISKISKRRENPEGSLKIRERRENREGSFGGGGRYSNHFLTECAAQGPKPLPISKDFSHSKNG